MRGLAIVCGDLHNLGDLLLLQQNLARVEPARHGPTTVRRWQPLPGEILAQVENDQVTVVNGKALVRYALSCLGRDMVIGGGQLVRSNGSLRSLVGLVMAAAMVRLGGGKVYTRGLGVSAIRQPFRRLLWRAVFHLSQGVMVREAQAERHTRQIAPGARIVVTADMAFLPNPDLFGQPAQSAGARRDGLVLAPCLDGGEDRLLDPACVQALLAACQAARPGLARIVACHDIRPAMDPAAARLLLGPAAAPDWTFVKDGNLRQLVATYRRADLVVTNRLHSVIMALHCGAAIIVLDDGNPKVLEHARQFALPVYTPGAALHDIDALVARALAFDPLARARDLALAQARAQENI